MKKLILLFLFSISTFSQVGINTNNPNAVLDITSSDSGILIPRLNNSEIVAIQNPTNSELVFNSTKNVFQYYINGYWKSLSSRIEYSLSEVQTNDIWIDDKPIYRKIFIGNSNASNYVIDCSMLNIESFVKYDSNIIDNNDLSNVKGFQVDSGIYSNLGSDNIFSRVARGSFYIPDEKVIVIKNQFTEYNLTTQSSSGLIGTPNYNYTIIIEYTKTTD